MEQCTPFVPSSQYVLFGEVQVYPLTPSNSCNPLSEWARDSAIVFDDLGLIPCRIGSKWIRPVMPKLRKGILNAVFYLYRIDPQSGKRTGPHGTGFVWSRQMKADGSQSHFYGISNWHLTHDLGASIIRLNTRDGKSRYLDFGPEDWHFLRGGDDLSAIDLTQAGHVTDEVGHYTEHYGYVSQHTMDTDQISVGEDVFMMGLFANHHGGERNIPAVRFGNIAMLAEKDALIEQPNGNKRPSHLVDMRSRTGFSGSPVILYRIPENDLSDIPGQPPPARLKVLTLLGVHCGQFYEAVEVRKSPPKFGEKLGDPIKDGDELFIQSGMNIVVPAWRVKELLDQEVFEVARQEREEKVRDWLRNRARGEAVVPPANDVNPNHQEDFMRLVGAATRKPAQED
jgi:hypothetical protein